MPALVSSSIVVVAKCSEHGNCIKSTHVNSCQKCRCQQRIVYPCDSNGEKCLRHYNLQKSMIRSWSIKVPPNIPHHLNKKGNLQSMKILKADSRSAFVYNSIYLFRIQHILTIRFVPHDRKVTNIQ